MPCLPRFALQGKTSGPESQGTVLINAPWKSVSAFAAGFLLFLIPFRRYGGIEAGYVVFLYLRPLLFLFAEDTQWIRDFLRHYSYIILLQKADHTAGGFFGF